MNCDRCQKLLTLYLDGDVSDDAGAMVRGHLRGCPACQQIASQEELVRDGLRSLSSIEPSAKTWDHIVQRLAQHEVVLASRPWHVRWWQMCKLQLFTPRIAVASTMVAVCSIVLVMRSQRQTESVVASVGAPVPVQVAEEPKPALGRSDLTQPAIGPANGPVVAGDVSADLLANSSIREQALQQTVSELQKDISLNRTAWSAEVVQQFEQQLHALNTSLATTSGRQREAGYRKLVAFLQTAAIGPLAIASEIGRPAVSP